MADKPWTVMVYMVADAVPDVDVDLYHAAFDDINEMTQAVTNDAINVVVQVDAPTQFPATRWLIENGKAKQLACQGVLKSFQQKCLLDFVEFCTTNYRANNYLLVMWGHGGGVDWISPALQPVGALGGGQGSMSLKALGTALRKLVGTDQDNLVVGFNACQMGTIEVYSEIREGAKWVIGGADELPFTGWPYDAILSRLVEDPNISPQVLVPEIVRDIIKSCNMKSQKNRVSFSACDLGNSLDFADSFKILLDMLTPHLRNLSILQTIAAARQYAEDYREEAMVDLHAFCWKLKRTLPGALTDAKKAAEDVVANLERGGKFVIWADLSASYSDRYTRNSGALAICFPKTGVLSGSVPGWRINPQTYPQLDFNDRTGWYNFLTNFHTNASTNGLVV